MSRDPLEGYRPSDTSRPSFSPAPSVSFESPIPPRPASAGSPSRGSGAKVIVLVVAATLFAGIAGGVAYFLTLPQAPLASKAKPTEVVVKQGPAPADEPSPVPTVKAK